MALPTYASPLERVWHWTYIALCVAIFVFLIAPIIVVIPLSFNAEPYFTFTEKMLSFDPDGYSMRWYDTLLTFGMSRADAPRDASWWADAWANAKWLNAAKNSLIVGFFSTILATVLGTLAALGLSRPEMPFRRIIMAVLISPMIVPIIITATGMFFFYSNPCEPLNWIGLNPECGKLAGTYLGVILAHATLGIPFVIITVTATLVGFDQSLNRAAASLGANPRRTFFRITMPLILPGVIAGAILGFAKAMGEFGAVAVVSGKIRGQTATMPITIEMLYNEYLSVAAFSMAALLAFLGLVTLMIKTLLEIRHADQLAAFRRR